MQLKNRWLTRPQGDRNDIRCDRLAIIPAALEHHPADAGSDPLCFKAKYWTCGQRRGRRRTGDGEIPGGKVHLGHFHPRPGIAAHLVDRRMVWLRIIDSDANVLLQAARRIHDKSGRRDGKTPSPFKA